MVPMYPGNSIPLYVYNPEYLSFALVSEWMRPHLTSDRCRQRSGIFVRHSSRPGGPGSRPSSGQTKPQAKPVGCYACIHGVTKNPARPHVNEGKSIRKTQLQLWARGWLSQPSLPIPTWNDRYLREKSGLNPPRRLGDDEFLEV